ncbi:pentapeptide repeat-containing protein [Hymenobacter perfusus]|uniref:Pentapeptide repeat-containing protein n=1 Tax=Hymenobacter perfusus TaxID=1236770 RepID=A0A428K3Y1_9BACT|nr:pentapeptide repeat-containing protein [Hymenobacter perfusus]
MDDIISKSQLLEAYRNGQRHFEFIELSTEEDFSNVVLSGAVFRRCWMEVLFVSSDLSNCQFIECCLKTADFRYANLTKAVVTGCTIESTRFQHAVVDGFVFSHNSAYGQDSGQEDFDNWIHCT